MSTSVALRPITARRQARKRPSAARKQQCHKVWYRSVQHAETTAQQYNRQYDICRADYNGTARCLRLYSCDGRTVLEYKPAFTSDECDSPLLVAHILVEVGFFESVKTASEGIRSYFPKFHIRKITNPTQTKPATVAINDGKKMIKKKKLTP